MSRRCSSCGHSLAPALSLAHDGACPWCLAAFTFGPESSAVATEDSTSRIGKYVRTEKLGAGGMGEVWKALDTELNRWVALKFLRDEDPGVVARFQREARTAARLSHPGIASVHEVGEAEGRRFIAMQYIRGRTMAEFPRNDRRLIVQLFRDAARALDHAHRQGVIHRDLKPENLMVEEREDGVTMVVLDFGLARPIEGGEKLSKSGEVYGTAPFMSPEQARGEPLDVRADVYSLGATLYEALTGKLPFEAPNLIQVIRKIERDEPPRPRKVTPGIPRDLETIVLKCLAKSRNRRYATARELADDLDRYLNHDPVRARPPSALYRVGMTLAKRKAAVAALVAAAVLAAAIGWWTFSGSPTARHLQLSADAMKLWAEARGLAMAGVDPEGIRKRAKDAREAFDRALEAKEDAPSLVMRARCLQLEGKDDEALKALERAYGLDPGSAEARLELAKALLVKYQISRGNPAIRTTRFDSGGEARIHFGRLPPENAEQRSLRERGERLLAELEAAPAQRGLLRGLIAMGRGDHIAAVEGLASHSKAEAWDAQALMLEGVCRYYLMDFAGAAEALGRSVGRVPNSVAYRWSGSSKEARGLHDEAIADFTKAIELDAMDREALLNRGGSLRAKRLLDEAIVEYSRAIGLDPSYAKAYTNRGVARQDSGRLDEAIADYTKAIELDPMEAVAFLNRGNAKRELGRLDEAVADLTKAVQLDPSNEMAFVNRAIVRNDMGLHDEAIADCDSALALDPNHPLPYVNRAIAKDAKGRFADSMSDFDKAMSLDPKLPGIYLNRGACLAERGDLDKAIADFTKTIELDPRSAVAFHYRGAAELEKGLCKESIADSTKAIALNPKFAMAFLIRGNANVALGSLEEAVADMEMALKVAPKGWPQRAAVEEFLGTQAAERDSMEGRRLFESKKFREAIEQFKKVLNVHARTKQAVSAAYNVACGYALLGEKENALDWLEKAVEMGWKDVSHVEKDSDLDSLRGEERYKKLVARLKGE